MSYDVVVIGCGGIGGAVIDMLPQVMACLNVDKLPEDMQEELLRSEGLDQSNYRNCFDQLILIDGDEFSGHNALRQAGTAGRKLAVQMNKIRSMDAFTVWLNQTHLVGYDMYIKPSNMGKIFARTCNPIIFLGVDNHKTRYEVTRWLEENGPDRFLLINGGNNKVTGNVTIYEKNYTILDPPIYKLYPEVNENADRRPDEVACGTVTVQNDQTVIINHMIASIMLNYFRKYVMWDYSYTQHKPFNQKTRQKGADGKPVELRMNEVVVDLETNTMMALSHKADTDNRRAEVADVENVPENAEIE